MSAIACGSKPVSATGNATRSVFVADAGEGSAIATTSSDSAAAAKRAPGERSAAGTGEGGNAKFKADLYLRGSVFGNVRALRFPIPMSIILYLAAIVACGGLGAVLGWAVAGAIGLTGTPMALVAAFVAMVAATLLWIAGAALLGRNR